jgi:hypothetical protein
MENLGNKPSTEVPSKPRKSIMAFASLIIGIFGCVLPGLALGLLFMYYPDLSSQLGSANANLF